MSKIQLKFYFSWRRMTSHASSSIAWRSNYLILIRRLKNTALDISFKFLWWISFSVIQAQMMGYIVLSNIWTRVIYKQYPQFYIYNISCLFVFLKRIYIFEKHIKPLLFLINMIEIFLLFFCNELKHWITFENKLKTLNLNSKKTIIFFVKNSKLEPWA